MFRFVANLHGENMKTMPYANQAKGLLHENLFETFKNFLW